MSFTDFTGVASDQKIRNSIQDYSGELSFRRYKVSFGDSLHSPEYILCAHTEIQRF